MVEFILLVIAVPAFIILLLARLIHIKDMEKEELEVAISTIQIVSSEIETTRYKVRKDEIPGN